MYIIKEFLINNIMGINQNIGQMFMGIEDVLSDEELLQLEKMQKKGIPKNHATVDIFLRNNLVECIQPRRLKPSKGFKETRHMLCTRNFWLAQKLARIRGYHMKVLHKRPKTWYKKRNLLLVWDVVFNDWRMIDLENPSKWRLLDFIPFKSDKQFRAIANIWTTKFKKIRYPDGSGVRTYCNFIRKGT